MKNSLRIEICKFGIKDNYNKYRLRIGDIAGSTEFGYISKEELLKEISDAIEDLKW